MKIVITAGELIQRGLWGEAAEILHINEWAINEGRMDSSDEVTLTEEQAEALGILPKRSGGLS